MNLKDDLTIELDSVLTKDQQKQLVSLLSMIVDHGFGELSIVFLKGRVRYFKTQLSISAVKEDE